MEGKASNRPYVFGIGKYEIDGNKLTVTHNDSSDAIFEISDGGDTLTLLSAKEDKNSDTD